MSLFQSVQHIGKKYGRVVLLIGAFVSVSLALGSIPSETLIGVVGSDNVYVLMFVLGTIGGLTTFTGLPYQLILMSFAAGGINPILLGISTALGVMIGDSTMFLLSRKVRTSLSPRVSHFLSLVVGAIDKHPGMFNIVLFSYGAISPFSNDFIIASFSIAGYSYRRVMLPLALGNICFNIALAYLGLYAYDSIVQFFM